MAVCNVACIVLYSDSIVSCFTMQLPVSTDNSPVREREKIVKTPLTPGSSKKAFMETLLTPSTNVQDQIYDKDKASDIFVQGHSDISISVSLYHGVGNSVVFTFTIYR